MRLLNLPGYALENSSSENWGKHTIIISIGEEWGNQPKLDHIPIPILKVQFSDVEDELQDKNYTLHPISKQQAEDILKFVREQKPKLVICHCAAGVSRSASVILALHHIFQGKTPKSFWRMSDPKPGIVARTLEADPSFKSREQAEETAKRLIAAGKESERIRIEEGIPNTEHLL